MNVSSLKRCRDGKEKNLQARFKILTGFMYTDSNLPNQYSDLDIYTCTIIYVHFYVLEFITNSVLIITY